MSPSSLPNAKFFNVTTPAPFVAHVEINRPSKMNAFCAPMWIELKGIFDHLSTDPDLRCIVLSGAGDRAFTAGLDVQEASQSSTLGGSGPGDTARKATSVRRHILELQDAVSSVARCEKPVIALVHGITFGLGIDLSTACDIRMAETNTKFSVKEVDIGLAADVGTLSRLPKVAGGLTSWVKEITLSARVFSAEEALKNNFVSRVVSGKAELIKQGIELAKYISTKSPVAVQGTKNILDAAWGRTVEDNLNYTAVWNAAMIQSTDVSRAMLSGLQKKTPTFEKL
ncbi:hypothetical protein PV10_00368 [Exophiala mesophila]|uniref:Enoyl-CoA hydratase n=1 Tax=Exophiala mesophila TaxID=212818 RepID=A0A0D1X430_EXOME|nr:uncharacterized protein PV10_00368 [Exophiala mesophila]KIV96510.1 hypothetical protein PV10_00368 [Exophiala mesophila]